MPSSSHLSSIFSDLEHCCFYIFTKCLKRANMCIFLKIAHGMFSHSTGPHIQLVLPFKWSSHSTGPQIQDNLLTMHLGVLWMPFFWAAPNIKILKETQQKSLVSNLICLFWRWEDTSVLKTVWSQSQFVFAPKASNSLLIYGPLETFNR